MKTRVTLFTATLVQDSALSVSGLDRESTADQPVTLVNGEPTLVGRGLKGAAVAMAKRFFEPLPRAVSDDIKHGALRRSAWEFADARVKSAPRLRAGVGIRHKTGARAGRVLYDREVIPSGTRWELSFRVDWSQVPENVREDEGREAEGILGYVLGQHWAQGRCWLGGGAARGLGWCHLEDLKAHRLDEVSYERWIESERKQPPPALDRVPTVQPTRSWCFRTLDVDISFGEYKPERHGESWGVDMLAIGPHDADRTVQRTGNGTWANPAWAINSMVPIAFATDRAIVMDGDRPLLPGASVRGALRQAHSRAVRASGSDVKDPHDEVGAEDLADKHFGTVKKSSRILIRDARAEETWMAAKLHMHAEDEFSAGSYGSAKRDAVRVLQGVFPVRVVIEAATPEDVQPLIALIDQQVALGALGHLPIGGHKTRGAGWGRWQAKPWVFDDVPKMRDWSLANEPKSSSTNASQPKLAFVARPEDTDAWVRTEHEPLDSGALTLEQAAKVARTKLGDSLVAWWCDPIIDLNLTSPPATFGRAWPEDGTVQVDEVAFYADRAVWRAARTSSGVRVVFIEEVSATAEDAKPIRVVHTPARLHDFERRFSSAKTGQGNLLLREWHCGDEILGFTITKEQR